MSAVYMCDSCGELFSVNQPDWKEFTERIRPEETNAYNTSTTRQRHVGPCCSGPDHQIRPRLNNTVTDLPELIAPKDASA